MKTSEDKKQLNVMSKIPINLTTDLDILVRLGI